MYCEVKGWSDNYYVLKLNNKREHKEINKLKVQCPTLTEKTSIQTFTSQKMHQQTCNPIKNTSKQTDKQTNNQTHEQTYKQTNKQRKKER